MSRYRYLIDTALETTTQDERGFRCYNLVSQAQTIDDFENDATIVEFDQTGQEVNSYPALSVSNRAVREEAICLLAREARDTDSRLYRQEKEAREAARHEAGYLARKMCQEGA